MGLLDDMAAEIRAANDAPPDGWYNFRTFAAASGMSPSAAKNKLEKMSEERKIQARIYRVNGRATTFYGDPV